MVMPRTVLVMVMQSVFDCSNNVYQPFQTQTVSSMWLGTEKNFWAYAIATTYYYSSYLRTMTMPALE